MIIKSLTSKMCHNSAHGRRSEEQKSLNLKSSIADEFHPKDLHRFKNDDQWVVDFLENNDFHMKNSFKQCMDTLEWRKSYGVNGEKEFTFKLGSLGTCIVTSYLAFA